MERPQKEFGDYLKEFRRRKSITLQQLADKLGVSLSLISDIENRRRNPLDEEGQMETIAEFLGLTTEEKEILYDQAARKRNSVPEDIKEVIMYSDEAEYVRKALRKTKSGQISAEQWREFLKGGENENN